jgi:D-lactate dehydrogenase (cytochrome)
MLVKKDQSIIQSYFEDHSGLLGGHAESVVVPETERDVRDFLLAASDKRIPVTVAGAGTGVTGGRIPFGGAVLSLEKLNHIGDIRLNGVNEAGICVQAGAMVKEIKAAADQAGWMYAPDPTERTCFIGGNIATNASGNRGFKFGSTRNYVQRLKVALSSGDILDIPRGRYIADDERRIEIPFTSGVRKVVLPRYSLPKIKNAAGYFNYSGLDLVDLFIGHEGTLGVVIEADLRLLPAITKTIGGVAFFNSMQDAWMFAGEVKGRSLKTRRMRSEDIDGLSLEYFDHTALELLRPDYPHIPAAAAAAILFEQDVSNANEEKIIELWTELLEKYGAGTERTWFASGLKEQDAFREFRHLLPEKVNQIVKKNRLPKVGTDLSVPVENFNLMLDYYYEQFEKSEIYYLVFGHIGDSHLHANLLPANQEEYARSRDIYVRLAEKAVELGGTVSAEHGIGKLKYPFIEKMVGKEGLLEMARFKKKLDPALILGRGNVIPEPLLEGI